MTSPPWLGESSAFEVSIDKNSTLADLKTVGGPGSHNPRPRKENGFENETVSCPAGGARHWFLCCSKMKPFRARRVVPAIAFCVACVLFENETVSRPKGGARHWFLCSMCAVPRFKIRFC